MTRNIVDNNSELERNTADVDQNAPGTSRAEERVSRRIESGDITVVDGKASTTMSREQLEEIGLRPDVNGNFRPNGGGMNEEILVHGDTRLHTGLGADRVVAVAQSGEAQTIIGDSFRDILAVSVAEDAHAILKGDRHADTFFVDGPGSATIVTGKDGHRGDRDLVHVSGGADVNVQGSGRKEEAATIVVETTRNEGQGPQHIQAFSLGDRLYGRGSRLVVEDLDGNVLSRRDLKDSLHRLDNDLYQLDLDVDYDGATDLVVTFDKTVRLAQHVPGRLERNEEKLAETVHTLADNFDIPDDVRDAAMALIGESEVSASPDQPLETTPDLTPNTETEITSRGEEQDRTYTSRSPSR